MANQEYLAKPPGTCCITGSIHDGTPRGRIDSVLGIPTYIAVPSEEKANSHIVLYFPDVWGISNNASLLADALADAGYLALVMDYFLGDDLSVYSKGSTVSFPENFDRTAWRNKYAAFASENVPKWTAAVKETFGTDKTKYACLGYCFGAPYVCDMLATEEVSAGAFAHPTLLKEEHFAALRQPLLLSCAENDAAFPTDQRRKAVDILQKEKKVYNLHLFQGVSHGFATKADLNDLYQLWCKEQSLRGIIDWFGLWLK